MLKDSQKTVQLLQPFLLILTKNEIGLFWFHIKVYKFQYVVSNY